MRLRGPISYFVDGVLMPPGTPLEVSDRAEAERLKRLGFVEIVPEFNEADQPPPANTPQRRKTRHR